MIELTRLNGHPLYLNCDLIKWAEAAPDTLLTLVDGEKVVIRESCAELVERIRKQRLLLLAELIKLMPEPETFLRATAAANVPGPWSRHDPETQPETGPEGKHTGPHNSEEEANTG
jgi:flagellar protein FlbD